MRPTVYTTIAKLLVLASWYALLIIAAVLANGLPGVAAGEPSASWLTSNRCYPSIFGSDNGVFAGRYPVADAAFDRHDFKMAFRAYYQYFFCFSGASETVNPSAEDSGAAALLRTSLDAAIKGNFSKALTSAIASEHLDPRFGEADFIAGNLYFILHNRHCANALWLKATQNIGYPSTSNEQFNSSAQAAQKMMQIHNLGRQSVARNAGRCVQ